MFCRKCGKDLSATIKFCGFCGTPSKFFENTAHSTETIGIPAQLSQNEYVPSSYPGPEPFYKTVPVQLEKGASPSISRILATFGMAAILIVSSIWLYGDLDDPGDEEKLNPEDNAQNVFDATLHIQFNSWRTQDQGQDPLSHPDPWIRVYLVNSIYGSDESKNTKVWKDSLEWYGDIEFEFGLREYNNSLGIVIELYDFDGQTSQNPDAKDSTLMDINPDLSGSNDESKIIAFWYNFSANDDMPCVTAFEIQTACTETISLSSGLPRYNLVEIEVDGKDDDGSTDEFDSYIRFVVWWEKQEPDLPADFYTKDSDGDRVFDYLDYNDLMDIGVTITLDEFGIDSSYDKYMNLEVFINGDSRYLLGQTGDAIRIEGGEMQSFGESFFFDLDEMKEYSIIQFVAYSSGSLFDTDFDLNGEDDNSNILTLYFYSYSGELSANYNGGYADGRNDTGTDEVTDAMLRYSVVMTNTASLGEEKSFEWNYKSKNYRYDMYIDPDVYYEFKSLDHDISDEYDWPAGFARFTTPDEQYVINLANDLDSMARSEEFTELETANFILSFVQTIDYKIENYTNYQGIQDYPKYPVEMLWDGQGDCEDSAALYASLMEALGYDAVLLLFFGDIDGHAAIGISVPGATGKSYEYGGVDYYYAETTDTGPSIGLDPTYYFYGLDMSRAAYTYDVG